MPSRTNSVHHVPSISRTSEQYIAHIVAECFEKERFALYLIECARMDMDDALRRRAEMNPERVRQVLDHIDTNLERARDNAANDEAISKAAKDVRRMSLEQLGPLL